MPIGLLVLLAAGRHEVLRLVGDVLRFPTLPDGRSDVHVVESHGHVDDVLETIPLAHSTDVVM